MRRIAFFLTLTTGCIALMLLIGSAVTSSQATANTCEEGGYGLSRSCLEQTAYAY